MSTFQPADSAGAVARAHVTPISSATTPSRRRRERPDPLHPYQLPHDVSDRLTSALAGYRNRGAAMALAIFLARFWSSRARMVRPFPIDRRALADREDLGLTEARIRGAIATLEEIGFLNRGTPPAGSAYQATPEGLHRRPILFGFGIEYGPLFAAANDRAARARARREGRAVHGRPIETARRRVEAPDSCSPKDKPLSGSVVIMGELEIGSSGEPGVGRSAEPSAVEAAVARLLAAAGLGRRGHEQGA